AGRDGRRRVADRGRDAATAAAPHHHRQPDLGQVQRRRNPRRFVAVVGIGGEPVYLLDADAGVVGRPGNRFAGQQELRLRRLPALVVFGLADSGDRDLVLDAVFAHRPSPLILSPARESNITQTTLPACSMRRAGPRDGRRPRRDRWWRRPPGTSSRKYWRWCCRLRKALR